MFVLRRESLYYGDGPPQEKEPLATQPSTSTWVAERPKKGPDYYKGLREEYNFFILDHELLPVPSVIEAIASRTISELTASVKTRKFMAVSREAMEEALKALNIGAKVFALISNAIWNILLVTEKAAKPLPGGCSRHQDIQTAEYMGTRKTWITLYWVPMYITEEYLGAFFSDYGPMEGVFPIRSKAGTVTSAFEIMMTFF